jgi:6-phosphogluconolactonase (cycloisomerase 2 family)
MRVSAALAATAIVAVAAGSTAATAGAHTTHHKKSGRDHTAQAPALFVQTDNLAGNAVAAYQRGSDGRLYGEHLYKTGGLGGMLGGSQVDHLASQGSLQYDAAQHLLFAVNAGSDTVTTFAVRGASLKRVQVISSGGDFPVSVTVHGDLVYVLNALGGGNVHGYQIGGGRLKAIPNSTRPLGLDPNATPQFTTTPGQVTFTPSGTQVLVTTKGNTNAVDVFGVDKGGALSSTPQTNTLSGDVPFSAAFLPNGKVAISEAGPNAVADFTLAADGQLTQIDSVATGGTATCWILADGHSVFAGNAGSAAESRITVGSGDSLTLAGSTTTDAGTVDATSADNGRYLYVQTGGNGIVDEFAVGAGGTLNELGTVFVPDAVGGEGIAAS